METWKKGEGYTQKRNVSTLSHPHMIINLCSSILFTWSCLDFCLISGLGSYIVSKLHNPYEGQKNCTLTEDDDYRVRRIQIYQAKIQIKHDKGTCIMF